MAYPRLMVAMFALQCGIATISVTAEPMSDVAPVVSLEQKVLGEAPQGWARIRARDKSSEISGREKRSQSKNGVAVFSTVSLWRLKTAGENFVLEATNQDGGNAKFKPLSAIGVNDRYAFGLARPSVEKEWNVKNLDIFGETAGAQISRKDAKQKHSMVAFPYSMYGNINTTLGLVPLPELIKEQAFKIKDVSPLEEDGRSLVKVTFSYTIAPGNAPLPPEKQRAPMTGGWMTLDPLCDWGIRSYEIALQQGDQPETCTTKIDYTATPTPTVSKFVTRQFHEGDYEFGIDVDILETLYRPIAASELTLTAYGLPEPGQSNVTSIANAPAGAAEEQNGHWSTGLLLLNVAIVVILLASIIYVRMARKRKTLAGGRQNSANV